MTEETIETVREKAMKSLSKCRSQSSVVDCEMMWRWTASSR
eukprot:COSAG04_NODE_985_length_8992_cov_18.901844_5_plen_41_part_00